MNFCALRFDADAARAEAWADALLEAGAMSVDMADPNAGAAGEHPLFAEPGAASETWPVTRITALFASAGELDRALSLVSDAVSEPMPPHARFDVPDQDWVRATQAQFAPLQVADRLWVVPSWAAPPAPDAINLMLDPGLAFGTGSHPTTRLCLQWLAAHELRGRSVLDYGCGSGILAIAAARLGAAHVVATDIDPQALHAARANAVRNGAAIDCVLPGALPPRTFDVVVANILANSLILLAPALAMRVREGGAIVLSGILDAQADEVRSEYARWFRIAVAQAQEGWVTLAGERTGS